MPLQPRSPDNFTRENLLLGFSQVQFRPLDPATGQLGVPVPLGILSGEELQKEINVIELNDGSAGTITVAREVLSSLKPSFSIETFNFRADLAQYIFGAQSITAQVANPAQPVVDEPIVIPTGAAASSVFLPLVNGDIDPTAANLTLTAQPLVDELVGNGDGTTGTTLGDFELRYKPNVLGDITRLQEIVTATGVVVRTFVPQAGVPAGANEAQVEVGATATSGQMAFFQNVASGNEIRADYAPTFDLVEDINAVSPDMVLDPLLGRINFPNLDPGPASSTVDALKAGQPVHLDYLYNRKAGYTLQPFTQGGGAFLGQATINHLPDIGINFIWDVPSVSIRIDDNALTFGSDDFGVGTLVLNLNDSGGSTRFGTMLLASERQAAA